MSRFRVLSVGQCAFDHGRIARFLEQSFEAQVLAADTHAEALDLLGRENRMDLVLINRVGDRDGASGLDLIRTIMADSSLRNLPVMLVSNDVNAQAEAERLGARPGFGKAELSFEETVRRLRSVLEGSPTDEPCETHSFLEGRSSDRESEASRQAARNEHTPA